MTPLYNIKIPGSNGGEIWAKLENQNPTGSHKDRSMALWVAYFEEQGARDLALSSSGNSAISAAKYCADRDIQLHAFLSPLAEKEKIAKIEAHPNVSLHISKTPNKEAFRFAKERAIPNLRASRDDNALVGYMGIAFELMEQKFPIDNIFIPTSSGATLEGIYRGYKFLENARPPKFAKIPSFFAVQTTKVYPIASYFDKDFIKEEKSMASAIVDRIAHRKDRVIEIIKETGGGGFVVSNKELEGARSALQDLTFGWQSALALAGFLKWRAKNSIKTKEDITVCLFTD